MHEQILNKEPVVFDDRINIQVPDFAEDPMNVPVSVEINGINDIAEIRVFADLNPIQKILVFKPLHIKPYIAFRFKVEQATPVRAAVKTNDGSWYVGGRWLEAAGGGCTAPGTGTLIPDWQDKLLNVTSRVKMNDAYIGRLRFKIKHPMDTGLADGIPEFYIKKYALLDESKREIAIVETFQPVSEDPVFSFDIYDAKTSSIELIGMDNNGNKLEALIRQ